jgi:uncharacterized membrane protein
MNLAQASTDTPSPLNAKYLGTSLLVTVVLILAVGGLVLAFRIVLARQRQQDEPTPDKTLIRSWLAVVLVSGLLLFAVASLFINDPSLWNLMMGGVIASAGTAIAFYFASKAAEQTQQNLLNAAFGGVGPITLPDIRGQTVANASKILEALKLALMTPPGTKDDQTVQDSSPPAGSAVKPGDTVTATVT